MESLAATTTYRLGFVLMAHPFTDILAPTQQGKSYAQIAIKATQWLRDQGETGILGITSMTSEQVRKIFLGLVTRPHRAYLEALAATQGVDLNALLLAAEYPPVPEDSAKQENPDDEVKHLRRAWPFMTDTGRKQAIDFIRQVESGEFESEEK